MIGISLDGIQNYTNLSMILPDYARMEYVEDPYLSTFDGLRVYKAYESSNVLELKVCIRFVYFSDRGYYRHNEFRHYVIVSK